MSSSLMEAARKRKLGSETFTLQNFGRSEWPISSTGPFGENIRLYLEKCTFSLENEDQRCTPLLEKRSSAMVLLYMIVENVRRSPSPFCDECRYSGWGGHLVSRRRYHLILPKDDCTQPLENFLTKENHLLHGVFHSNGYGHLLLINGMEKGSEKIRGSEIMDLWDAICTKLRTRKITVKDTARKGPLDLRLLYGVSYERGWFGNWGYSFYKGSFGVSVERYNTAIKSVSSLTFYDILKDMDGRTCFREVKEIISHYCHMSKTQLVTLRDILSFMLILECCRLPSRKPTGAATFKPMTCKKYADSVQSDIVSLYKAIVDVYSNSHVRTILDSKRFVKEWDLDIRSESRYSFITCSLKVNSDGVLPGVIVSLPENSTFAGLKKTVEKSLKETYCIKEQFVLKEIQEFEQSEDGDIIPGTVTEICVSLEEIDLHNKCKYQAGIDNRNLKCHCGAEEDDGERWVSCGGGCEVWQHSRCNNIDGDVIFECPSCKAMNSSDSDGLQGEGA